MVISRKTYVVAKTFRNIFFSFSQQMSKKIHVLDEDSESMTFAWLPCSETEKVEITINTNPGKLVTIKGGMLKKKNLEKNCEITLHIENFPPQKFLHDYYPHPAAPSAAMELHSDGTCAAIIQGKPITNSTMYEIHMLCLGEDEEFVKIKNDLKNPIVKKKNLNPNGTYCFRYRGLSPGGEWERWSAASLPVKAPRVSDVLTKAVAPVLIKGDGTQVETKMVLSDKIVALYFSASWCPPCRATTPKLVEFSNTLKALGKPVEFVFVSADNDEASFKTYFEHMPGWFAVPYNHPRREALQTEHQIRGIPSLKVVSGRTGALIEGDALKYPMTPVTFDAWFAKL